MLTDDPDGIDDLSHTPAETVLALTADLTIWVAGRTRQARGYAWTWSSKDGAAHPGQVAKDGEQDIDPEILVARSLLLQPSKEHI